jgi:hypothetical protein
LRYFDTTHRLCETIKGRKIQKATKWDDPVGLPFVAPAAGAPAPFNRSVTVTTDTLLLKDHEACTEVPMQPAWGSLQESLPENRPLAPGGWPAFFGGTPPAVTPQDAFSAVLLYPEDDTEIGELASQPFVADHIQDSFEQDPRLAAHLSKSRQALIDNFDAAIKACINLDRPRAYTVLFSRPAHAQKQAQNLWSELARSRRFDMIKQISFLPTAGARDAYRRSYDLLSIWVPFGYFTNALKQHELVKTITGAIGQGGLAYLVGPAALNSALQTQQLRILQVELVETLPTFLMHRTILPKARLKPELTLFLVEKK